MVFFDVAELRQRHFWISFQLFHHVHDGEFDFVNFNPIFRSCARREDLLVSHLLLAHVFEDWFKLEQNGIDVKWNFVIAWSENGLVENTESLWVDEQNCAVLWSSVNDQILSVFT